MDDKPRRRWFRISLRTLFVVVTVVAVGCWMWIRSHEFSRRAEEHGERANHGIMIGVFEGDGSNFASPYFTYHSQMRAKYERAARYPWLPVEPDPPEPTD
jgi:hypothetical protein